MCKTVVIQLSQNQHENVDAMKLEHNTNSVGYRALRCSLLYIFSEAAPRTYTCSNLFDIRRCWTKLAHYIWILGWPIFPFWGRVQNQRSGTLPLHIFFWCSVDGGVLAGNRRVWLLDCIIINWGMTRLDPTRNLINITVNMRSIWNGSSGWVSSKTTESICSAACKEQNEEDRRDEVRTW